MNEEKEIVINDAEETAGTVPQDPEPAGQPEPEETPAEETPAEEASAENGREEGKHKDQKKKVKKLEAKIAELEGKLADAEAEIAARDGKYLLLYAEYDNFRKRTQKEREGVWTEAYSDAINSLLPVLDNLERAVAFTDAAGLADGLKMTVKSYTDALAKMGVTEIPALGEKFNPAVHCAVMHVDDENFGENEIVEVFGKGYQRDGKVIRYAMVKVAN